MISYTPREGRSILAAGTYVARVKSAQEAYTMNGDLMIEMEVLVGPNAEMRSKEKLYATEAAEWKITQVRHALGFTDEIGIKTDFHAQDLVECSGVVEIGLGKKVVGGKHDGKQFTEILRWMPRGSIALGPDSALAKDEIPMDYPAVNVPF